MSAPPPDAGGLHWESDRLLPGYEAATWVIPEAVLAAGEPDVRLTATLVRRNAPRHRAAILYVHGWNDYFFQTHVADVFDAAGFDFHALDLRRYGRNLREGLYAGYVTDLHDYSAEIDVAIAQLRRHHDVVVLMGHSTGGLTASLWAGTHPGEIDALVLNSPWLDMTGSEMLMAISRPVIERLGRTAPLRAIGPKDRGFTRRSTHLGNGGEWAYDVNLKTSPGFVTRAAWVGAVLAGQREVAGGLGIDVPVLIVTSGASSFLDEWDDALSGVDFVLDVERITAAAVRLGNDVTIVRVPGALHDVTLSAPDVRQRALGVMTRWLTSWAGVGGAE